MHPGANRPSPLRCALPLAQALLVSPWRSARIAAWPAVQPACAPREPASPARIAPAAAGQHRLRRLAGTLSTAQGQRQAASALQGWSCCHLCFILSDMFSCPRVQFWDAEPLHPPASAPCAHPRPEAGEGQALNAGEVSSLMLTCLSPAGRPCHSCHPAGMQCRMGPSPCPRPTRRAPRWRPPCA